MNKLTTAAIVALALAAITPTSAKADDLISPVQGAVRKVYNIKIKNPVGGAPSFKRYFEDFASISYKLMRGGETPYSTSVDTDISFKVLTESTVNTEFAMWSGFLKRRSGGMYSFIISTTGGNVCPIYGLYVNGNQIIAAGTKTNAKNVVLNPGFNEIVLVVSKSRTSDISLSIKKADSIKDPTNIGPGDLWHEDEPDDEDEDDE